MSQREVAKRHMLIRNKLLRTSKGATFAEIADYLSRQSELDGDNFNISKRTFLRDIKEIYEIYGIDIQFDRSQKVYYIENDFDKEANNRFFEAFELFNALKMNEQNRQYIHLEKRQASGTEHLYLLLHAIKNRLQVSFSYQKYYMEKPEQRVVNPLILKEFKNRWYLIARKQDDKQIRRYALDRLSDLETSRVHFPEDTDFDMDKMYQHCFGVIYPGEIEPQKIVLSFDPFQGNYIKSLPLHETQKILIDNDKEFRVSLNIYLTQDFIMEVLSYGETVKIIEPKSFAEEMKEVYHKALGQYL